MYAIICETQRVPMREIYQQGFQSIEAAMDVLFDLGLNAATDPKTEEPPHMHNFDTMLTYRCQNDLWKFKIVEEEMVGA